MSPQCPGSMVLASPVRSPSPVLRFATSVMQPRVSSFPHAARNIRTLGAAFEQRRCSASWLECVRSALCRTVWSWTHPLMQSDGSSVRLTGGGPFAVAQTRVRNRPMRHRVDRGSASGLWPQTKTAPEGAVFKLLASEDYFLPPPILVKAWKASVEALVICS